MWGGGGVIPHMMVALKLQQFQYNVKKIFLRRLWRLVFPWFCVKVTVPPMGEGGYKGGGGSTWAPDAEGKS